MQKKNHALLNNKCCQMNGIMQNFKISTFLNIEKIQDIQIKNITKFQKNSCKLVYSVCRKPYNSLRISYKQRNPKKKKFFNHVYNLPVNSNVINIARSLTHRFCTEYDLLKNFATQNAFSSENDITKNLLKDNG